jgi:hypothetical protein
MAEEKAVPYKSVGPGTNILQGRGGQAIIQDIVGNIFLTTQNNTGSNQRILSVNDSISSIAILSGEAPVSIGTEIDFPSRNFNTINYEQTPIGGVQVIQPIRNVTTQSLNIVVDLPPTSSLPTSSVVQQVEQKITPIEEQILFLPDSETDVFSVITDQNIQGISLVIEPSLNSILESINGFSKTTTYNLSFYEKLGGEQPYKRTITTPQELIKAGKAKKIDKQLLKSIISIIRIEQSYKGFNFNFSGTEARGWPGIEKYSNGYVYGTEGGTGLRKPFVSFKSLGDQLDFIKAAFERKKLKISPSQSAQEWAKLWYENWNGYGARTVKSKVAKFKTEAEFDAYVINNTAKIYSEIDKFVNQLY